jgi:hypothetical protein
MERIYNIQLSSHNFTAYLNSDDEFNSKSDPRDFDCLATATAVAKIHLNNIKQNGFYSPDAKINIVEHLMNDSTAAIGEEIVSTWTQVNVL